MYRILWKIFAVMTIAATFGGFAMTRSEPASFWKSLESAISIVSCAAIFGYAFSKQILPKQLASGFAWIFSAYIVWINAQSMINLYSDYTVGKSSATIAVAAYAVLSALNFLEWLSVWRYANGTGGRAPMHDMAKPQ